MTRERDDDPQGAAAPSLDPAAGPRPGLALHTELVPRACPLCGSADDSRVFAEADFDPAKLDGFAFASRKLPEYMHYRLVSCPVCDLLYANPLPTLETLARAYQAAEFDSLEEAHYASLTYRRYLPGIARRLPDRDGALDIGTGNGVFLEHLLEAGFVNIVGVEPSTAPIAVAKDEIRPLIRQGLFRPQEFEPGRYSLVSCFQTMEHVYEPMAMARHAHTLLKPGGAAFFIGHNRRAVSAKLLGLKSPIFDIEHLQLFSPRSARTLLERCGFRDVEIRVVVNRYPLHYWMKLFPLPAGLKRGVVAALKTKGLGRLTLPLPAGNIACIGYK
jgi:SAM-dependent methyltransferase